MLPISILTVPRVPEAASGNSEEGAQALATALGRCTERPISIFSGSWRDAPSGGFLIAPHADVESSLAICAPDLQKDLAARTIVLGAMWPNVYRFMDENHLAGAIDLRRFWSWLDRPESDTGHGIFGMISVAERAGMRWESGQRYGSETYGILGCPDHCRDLPSLLVHYLSIYEALGLHRSPQT